MKKVITTDLAPRAVGPYSQAIAAGDLVFCSGQIGIDPATGQMAGPGIEEQVRQCLLNLSAVLETAGSGLPNVVKTTVFLIDMNDFAVVNNVYSSMFTGEPPARSAVAVSALPKGARVEIEAIALR
jgi:2-iminobutanoate/2-iminopropanoate deaminase